MKKILALLLTVLLIVGCAAVSVSAAATLPADLEKAIKNSAPDDFLPAEILDDDTAYELRTPLNVTENAVEISVPSGDVEAIADHDVVREIDYSPDVIVEPAKETEPSTEPPSELDLEERFEQWALETHHAKQNDSNMMMEYIAYNNYKELYRHAESNGNMDWALLYVSSSPSPDWEIEMNAGGRIIYNGSEDPIFKFDYGVYDAAEDTFYDLFTIRDTIEKYSGLTNALNELKIGRPVGDADSDNTLTILDATKIQRLLADLEPKSLYDDCYGLYTGAIGREVYCFSDYDLDGSVTIVDATAIQRKLADL